MKQVSWFYFRRNELKSVDFGAVQVASSGRRQCGQDLLRSQLSRTVTVDAPLQVPWWLVSSPRWSDILLANLSRGTNPQRPRMTHRLRMLKTFCIIFASFCALDSLDIDSDIDAWKEEQWVTALTVLNLFQTFVLAHVQGCEMKKLKISTSVLGCMVSFSSHFSRIWICAYCACWMVIDNSKDIKDIAWKPFPSFSQPFFAWWCGPRRLQTSPEHFQAFSPWPFVAMLVMFCLFMP